MATGKTHKTKNAKNQSYQAIKHIIAINVRLSLTNELATLTRASLIRLRSFTILETKCPGGCDVTFERSESIRLAVISN